MLGARIGGIPELIEEGVTGMTFESGNGDDLTDKIGRMYDVQFFYEDIARKAMERYDAGTYYERIEKLYSGQ